MYDYFAPNEQGRDAALAIKLLFQPWRWHKGKEINNLKRRLKSRFFSSDTTLSLFFSGRGALHQYLKSLELREKTHVLLPPTCSFQTILVLRDLNLIPTIVDCDTRLGMSMKDLKKKYHAGCSVLIIDHPLGVTPTERTELLKFAQEKKLAVIEDVRSGFDLNLFKDKRFTSTILWSFRSNGMISSVYGALIAVRGKKQTQRLKNVEKSIPQPSVITILKMLFYKIGSVMIKSTKHMGIGTAIYALTNTFAIFPPKSTKKEHQGRFDSFFLRIFPNVCAILLSPQLDRFNDVVRKRSRVIKTLNLALNQTFDVKETAIAMYPLYLPHPTPAQVSVLKRLQIKKPQHLSTMSQKLRADGIFKKQACPVYESIIENVYIIPTSIALTEQKRMIELLTGVPSKI